MTEELEERRDCRLNDVETLRVLELYSGIGGMHFALKNSGISAEVVAAIDINPTANHIYQHNFPSTQLWNKTIEGLSLDDFNKLSFHMLLMSPPCQPFTRLGLQGDVNDPRTKSFLYIVDLIPRLKTLPRFILLENVKGFESSVARDRMVQMLGRCGYSFQEVMVSPSAVGLPNSRLRYFLIAKIAADGAQISAKDMFPVADGDPGGQNPPHPEQKQEVLYKLETANDAERKMNQNKDLSVRQIQEFLEPQSDINMELYLLPPKTLLRYALILDIVRPSCRRSVCFTKNYGRYVEGTGSVLQCSTETKLENAYKGLELVTDEEKLQQLCKLKLRYFTPREVANLMGFPDCFSFPDDVPVKQRYKVLGNSLNVVVVSRLLQQLVS
ncbi:tRNA (cytosine(38)-C(5))-methyltransferase isoform 1-T1 [Synchiropus picturatus]